MKNDIYTMLNEADIDLEQYEREDFNDIEKIKIKKKFRKSISKGRNYKKNIAVASIAAIALTLGILGSNMEVSAIRVGNTIIGDIANFLGIQKNLDEYKTVINKAITDNSITVKLNEVILDGSELIVSYDISSNKKLADHEVWIPSNTIYINGKKVSTGAGGGSRNIDEYTSQGVMSYALENMDLNGDLKVKILCSSIRLNGKDKRGSWNFEFKTNEEKLKIDTKEIILDNKFTLENGTEYTLKKYTSNALGQKIYASISNLKANSAYDIELKGTDDLGNKVEFYAAHIRNNEALFKIERINGNFNDNAKTLTLTPYAAKYPEKSGRMDGEYKPVGDKFTIDLTQINK